MAKKLAFDRLLFTAVVLLVGLGLVMVYSASAAYARGGYNPFLVKQAAAALLGLGAMAVVMHLDYRWAGRPVAVYLAVGGVLVLLVAVLFAPELNESHRWLFLAGVSVQPSELAKLALVLFLAYQLARKEDRVHRVELLLPALGLTALMAALVQEQPDLSTALLLAVLAAVMLFLGGLPWRYMAGGALVLAPLVWFAVWSVPYRRERLLAFLDPQADPLGSGFQTVQSLIAVGSGGLFGLGLGESVQKLYFLPYPHSDFIFSIIAEELGMVGCLAVLVLFALVGWRGIRAGWQAPDLFGRYLAWGFSSLLVLQALLHVSVALAVIPATGIPLPLVAYGGSSMVCSLLACGVILNVSQHG